MRSSGRRELCTLSSAQRVVIGNVCQDDCSTSQCSLVRPVVYPAWPIDLDCNGDGDRQWLSAAVQAISPDVTGARVVLVECVLADTAVERNGLGSRRTCRPVERHRRLLIARVGVETAGTGARPRQTALVRRPQHAAAADDDDATVAREGKATLTVTCFASEGRETEACSTAV